MNTELAALGNIIEFSIGLGGFSAIVAVFMHREQELEQVDKARILNLLFMSLVPAFAAFFAIGFSFVTDDAEMVFRSASAFYVVFMSMLLVVAVEGRRRVPREARLQLMPTVVFGSMSIFAGTNIAFQVVAVTGYFGSATFVVLYFGLVASLSQGVFQFIRIIVARPGKAT